MIGIDLLLLGAVAVLATMLLFGFVGCGLEQGGVMSGLGNDDYPTTIQKTPGLVAYWRLQERFPPTPVPSSGGAAVCENDKSLSGDYFNFSSAKPDEPHVSNRANGTVKNSNPLLDLLPLGATSVQFDGGFMRVPYDARLNPSGAFTFEAWVTISPPVQPVGHIPYYQCIVESRDSKGGWGLYLGPQDPNTSNNDLYWLLFAIDSYNQFVQVALSPKKAVITSLQPSFLVLTNNGTMEWTLWIYIAGTNPPQGLDKLDLQAIPPTGYGGFKPNGSGAFYIGAGSNLFPAALPLPPPSRRLYPFVGSIQEVAFYNQDLSAKGVQE